MFNGSNCDWKSQLSGILTEPLNPRGVHLSNLSIKDFSLFHSFAGFNIFFEDFFSNWFFSGTPYPVHSFMNLRIPLIPVTGEKVVNPVFVNSISPNFPLYIRQLPSSLFSICGLQNILRMHFCNPTVRLNFVISNLELTFRLNKLII